MSGDSGFGDDSSFRSLSRQSSNLSSVGANGDLFSYKLQGQEKKAQDWDNQDEVIESKRFDVNQPQSFNSLVYVPDTADVNNAKRSMLHQGQRMKANNFTQLRSGVNNTRVNKGPINSIERRETKLNSLSKSITHDTYSDISTTNSRNGNQYTEANSHSQLHNSANNTTNTKVIKAVHGSENWEFDLKSMLQPNSYVTHSQFGKNISENENWEMDLIDVNNNGFYPKIEYSTLDKSIPNIYQKNELRIPIAKLDWENEIYDSDTSPESDDETLCHVQKMSSDMNENSGCPETTFKYDTDRFVCVSDQSPLKANSVINAVHEKDLEALEINSFWDYQDFYRSAESSYDTASSCSVITEADGVLPCSANETLNETGYAWGLIEDLSDGMQNISIHSPPERSPSPANHSSESPNSSLDKQIKFKNVKNCTLPNFEKNIYLPDDKEHECELIDKTSIAQYKHFNKSNSYSDKEASFSVMKDNSRRVLVHIREPISPTSSADFIQRVEGTMPGITISAKWRRKMFAKYMKTFDVKVILDNDVPILQYSIEQLVGYANSPASLTIPYEWSYLTKIFPEVCLYERLDFDPEKFLENYSKGNTMDRFRYCRENVRNSQPNQYNTQDKGDRNKERSITQPIRNGFGVPRQNRYEEFTANINKERSVTPPIRNGFAVPRKNSNEEFTANIHAEEKPVVSGRGGFGCRRQNSSDKLVPNICTESRHMSPPWGLPHKCPW
ncbi:hypothetical protein CHS0354_017443 [Potamilus streckersoni]|uniref:Uncharacterized protein n=1 Tax=Potamilus streckersoni TaxID=2493646 RepID=A0AAE0SC08_9BIVA|nr:hypothetical protein CHS0354_017443 [Potamilus streckersoni]